MSISLQKKQSISLSKAAPSLKNLLVSLTWTCDPSKLKKDVSFDADLSAFVCQNGKVIDDSFTCFFNNQETSDHSVKALDGDDRGSSGDGEERISVDLSKIDARADQIVFVTTIDRAAERNQTFGQITTGSISVTNADNSSQLCEFKYGDGTYTSETAIQVASLVRNGNEWEFHAIGDGGIKDFVTIAVEDFGYPQP